MREILKPSWKSITITLIYKVFCKNHMKGILFKKLYVKLWINWKTDLHTWGGLAWRRHCSTWGHSTPIFVLWALQELLYHYLHHSPMDTKGFIDKNVVSRMLLVKLETRFYSYFLMLFIFKFFTAKFISLVKTKYFLQSKKFHCGAFFLSFTTKFKVIWVIWDQINMGIYDLSSDLMWFLFMAYVLWL